MKTILVQIFAIAVFLMSSNSAVSAEKKMVAKTTVTESFCAEIPYGRYNNPSKVQQAAYDALSALPIEIGKMPSCSGGVHITMGKRVSKVCIKVKMRPLD